MLRYLETSWQIYRICNNLGVTDKNTAQQALEIVKKRGMLRPRDLDRYGIPRVYLTRLCERGLLQRVNRGLYVLPDAEQTEHHTLAEACKRIPSGILCLLSALRFHQITTQAPFEIWMALKGTTWHPKIDRPKIRFVRFSGPAFETGIEQHKIEGVSVKVYNPPKNMIGNKGYRKYLKVTRGGINVDQDKIAQEARFDGKWVLKTNADLPAEKVALKYKELWQVEHVFRDLKSILETRPIYHKCDETIRGHVFCSFLALVLRKELDRRLDMAGHCFEWADVKQDLKALQKTTIEDNAKVLSVRSQCLGACSKVFQAVGVAIPPTIREL